MEIPSISDTRKQQAQNLAQLIRSTELQLGARDNPKIYGVDQRYTDKYGQLGEKIHSGLVKAAQAIDNAEITALVTKLNALNGCHILTRLISFEPPAYAAFLAQPTSETAPSVNELTTIMRASPAAYRPFADCDIKSNQTLETYFGLQEFSPIYEDIDPFIISPDKDGALSFKPSSKLLNITRFEIARRIASRDIDPVEAAQRRCPAMGFVLDTLWGLGVTEAGCDPDLYTADLANCGVIEV